MSVPIKVVVPSNYQFCLNNTVADLQSVDISIGESTYLFANFHTPFMSSKVSSFKESATKIQNLAASAT